MRFGSTTESERWVQWYFVDGAEPLPVGTRFGSLNWADDAASPWGPGEVVGAPRIWVNGETPAWPAPTQYCGSADDWANGFGVGAIPELPIDPVTGRPVCCALVSTPCCLAGWPAVVYLVGIRISPFPSPRYVTLTYDGVDSWRGVGDFGVPLPGPALLDLRMYCGLVGLSQAWRIDASGCMALATVNAPAGCPPGPLIFGSITIPAACTGLGGNSTWQFQVRDTPWV